MHRNNQRKEGLKHRRNIHRITVHKLCIHLKFSVREFFDKKRIKNGVFIPTSYKGVRSQSYKQLQKTAGKCTKTEGVNLYDSPNFSVLKNFFAKSSSKTPFLSLPLMRG